ncbi:MAG TPA: hypothetical protein VFU47_00965, partial [Armatimonadota bacterium]|nr:hypothetical protein [Armatimonadota bacterium]
MRGFKRIGALLLVAALPAAGQVEELFSRHIQIFKPRGEFASRLIKLRPPSGEKWTPVSVVKPGFRLMAPRDARVNAEPS